MRTVQYDKQGFTAMEILVVAALATIILGAGSILFVSGNSIWSVSRVKSELRQDLRKSLQYISFELQESGDDENGVSQVTINDGGGNGGTDILQFAVPLCLCGMSAIDEDGNVSRWGAPSPWGTAGCSDNYTLNAQGKVDICHIPPGDPDNPVDTSVSESSVKAHLAHGDYLGSCSACDADNYTNRQVEYSVNGSSQLVRRVLDTGGNEIASTTVASNITDFQASLNGGETAVTVTIQFEDTALHNRPVDVNGSMNIRLHNGG